MARSIPKGNPSEMADAQGILIPAGDYWDVLIDSVKDATAKKSGKPMYEIRLVINDDVENAKGRRLTTRACLWFEARYSIIQLNKSLGMPTLDENGDFYVGEPYEYQGQTTAIRVVHESSEEYGDQASVKSFLVQKSGGAAAPKTSAGKVPFGSTQRSAPAASRPAPARRPAPSPSGADGAVDVGGQADNADA